MKRILALCMTALMLFLMLPASSEAPSYAVPREGEPSVRLLEARVSEGVTARENSEGSLSILAHEEGGELVFDETKTLVLELFFEPGWLFCEAYSCFFRDDPRVYLVNPDPGVYEYFFEAVEGESVALSAWNGVYINASASELPKLYIDAALPFDEIDRETWVDASFTLTVGTKEFASGGYEGAGSVKGRGNSSWLYPKKPYSIKLSSKASLLDIPKTKKYAIIPSYHDGSLMRNYITYKIWQGLVGIDYVPKCEFADVYLNGEYNGIYLLVERIDVESNKIDIDEADEAHLSGGYLIEKDVNGKVDFDDDLWFDCPYWANQSQDYFVMKAPEPEDEELTELMLEYLTGYMQELHDAVMGISGESWERYVDVSSWIDFIIVQEVAKNVDGCMKTSCFMYKDRDDDHLYMTAPWDFDFAYGRVNWNNASEEHNDAFDCPNADTPDGFMIVNSSNPWMDKLYDEVPEFRLALMERYTEYRGTLIEDMFAMIEEQAAYLAVVQQPNYALWGKSFSTGVRTLRSWLRDRIEWLDGEWLVEEVYSQGDYDQDGEVTLSDALRALRRAMGLLPPSDNDHLADMDGDGSVTALDALRILRLAMGLGVRESSQA